jgi:hypothetical protein
MLYHVPCNTLAWAIIWWDYAELPKSCGLIACKIEEEERFHFHSDLEPSRDGQPKKKRTSCEHDTSTSKESISLITITR